ncbi:MAG: hypothetical protein GXY33_18585 [Phycisphaerae bacterium]|nr:hypothetical protein [Phycisphaerae bacterium]
MRALKVCLWIAGIGCLLAVIGLFLPMTALNAMAYGVLVPFSGFAAIFVGVSCLLVGLATKLPPLWFLGDFLSCTIIGLLIVLFWRRVRVPAVPI